MPGPQDLEVDFLEAEGQLLPLLRNSLSRIHSEMAQFAPFMARKTARWMQSLSPTGRADDYFRGARSPLLLLPWWLEKVIRGAPDLEFQAKVVYSTTNAYYFVRLMDNVMDRHDSKELGLLPAGSFFLRSFRMPTGNASRLKVSFGEFCGPCGRPWRTLRCVTQSCGS